MRQIELVFFEGCPHVACARENLRRAIEAELWTEWDLNDPGTPEDVRRFGSPTVLVDRVDVTGAGGGNAGRACRADGAPSVDVIRRALEEST